MITRSLATVLLVAVMAVGHALAEESSSRADIVLTSCSVGASDTSGQCCSCRSCCSGCRACCCRQFEFTGGYLYMAREFDRNSPLVTSASSGQTVVGMSNLEGHYGSGFEVSGRLSRLEIRYMQVSNSDGALAPASGANQIAYQGDSYFSELVLDYDADLYGGEINLLCSSPCEPVRLSGGLRYLRLNEDIAASFPGFTGIIFTDTRNDMLGLQMGLDFDVLARPDSPFSLICTSKAGAFYSNTRLASFPNAAAASQLGSTSDSSARGAFVGELGLLGRAQITRRLTVDVGYNLMYLTGVALAGDQSQNIDQRSGQPATSHIQSGDVLYHGLVARATFTY